MLTSVPTVQFRDHRRRRSLQRIRRLHIILRVTDFMFTHRANPLYIRTQIGIYRQWNRPMFWTVYCGIRTHFRLQILFFRDSTRFPDNLNVSAIHSTTDHIISCPSCHRYRMGMSLFNFLIISKNAQEIALDEFSQPRDCNNVKASIRFKMPFGVRQENL